MNNVRILYSFNEETERVFLKRLTEYLNARPASKLMIKENQIARWENPKKLLHYIEKRAMLEFETKKILKFNLDETIKNNFTLPADSSGHFQPFPDTRANTCMGEKSCNMHKGLDLLSICFYDFTRNLWNFAGICAIFMDQPLYNKKMGSRT